MNMINRKYLCTNETSSRWKKVKQTKKSVVTCFFSLLHTLTFHQYMQFFSEYFMHFHLHGIQFIKKSTNDNLIIEVT